MNLPSENLEYNVANSVDFMVESVSHIKSGAFQRVHIAIYM